MKITVVGCGYVGLSLAVLLSQKFDVTAYDLSKHKIDLINSKNSPIDDKKIQEYLKDKFLYINATNDKDQAYKACEYVIIATPTNYDVKNNSFDTSTVESVIFDVINKNKKATIVIKSTIPFGFTDEMRSKYKNDNIFFSPEFLRESNALYDNLYPSRIVIGDKTTESLKFGEMLIECAEKPKDKIPLFFMSSKEAEAVKLFSNTYLAMRVSFFNELDTFAEISNISSKNIIDGVSSDSRIGNYYNNPSFGYGGYCLPKDTKQLLDNFNDIPNNIITAVVEANKTRKKYIVKSILKNQPKVIGIYRLIMKEGSDNFRESAVIDILREIKNNRIKVILFEPYIKDNIFDGVEVVNDLKTFISRSSLIIANRFSKEIEYARNKIYSRDLFHEN